MKSGWSIVHVCIDGSQVIFSEKKMYFLALFYGISSGFALFAKVPILQYGQN